MSRDFRGLYACVLLALVCPGQSSAEALSLKQAVQLAIRHAPEISIQAQVLAEAEGARTHASVLPNPQVEYGLERLRQNGVEGGEWSVSVSTPLRELLTRGPSAKAAGIRVEAEQRTLDHTRARVSRDVQTAYVRYHYANRRRLVFGEVSGLFLEAARRGSLRKAEGDISAYEKQRIDLEALRYERLASRTDVEAANSRRGLAYFLVDREEEFETFLPESIRRVEGDLQEAIDTGLKHRADLLSARARVRAAEADVVSEGRQGLPAPEMSFGFKRQDDGFEGATVGLSIGLPIFDRNQGRRKSATAAARRNRVLLHKAQRRVTVDVANAYEQYRATKDQMKRMNSGSSPEGMLKTVQTAYNEGAMSLVEMLDGLRAYQDAVSARLDLEESHYLSQIELEMAMGLSLDNRNP